MSFAMIGPINHGYYDEDEENYSDRAETTNNEGNDNTTTEKMDNLLEEEMDETVLKRWEDFPKNRPHISFFSGLGGSTENLKEEESDSDSAGESKGSFDSLQDQQQNICKKEQDFNKNTSTESTSSGDEKFSSSDDKSMNICCRKRKRKKKKQKNMDKRILHRGFPDVSWIWNENNRRSNCRHARRRRSAKSDNTFISPPQENANSIIKSSRLNFIQSWEVPVPTLLGSEIVGYENEQSNSSSSEDDDGATTVAATSATSGVIGESPFKENLLERRDQTTLLFPLTPIKREQINLNEGETTKTQIKVCVSPSWVFGNAGSERSAYNSSLIDSKETLPHPALQINNEIAADKDKEDIAYACPFCAFETPEANGLIQHLGTHEETAHLASVPPVVRVKIEAPEINIETPPTKDDLVTKKIDEDKKATVKTEHSTNQSESKGNGQSSRTTKRTKASRKTSKAPLSTEAKLVNGRKIKTWSCPICKKTVTFHYKNTHMLLHKDEKPFKCIECPKTSRQLINIRGHIKRIHGKDIPLAKLRKLMNIDGVNKKSLNSPMKEQTKRIIPTRTTETTYSALVQEKVSEIDSGSNKVQSKTIARAPPRRKSKWEPCYRKKRTKKGIKCGVCGKIVFNLGAHMRWHPRKNRYGCSLCPQKFITFEAVQTHTKEYHENSSNNSSPVKQLTELSAPATPKRFGFTPEDGTEVTIRSLSVIITRCENLEAIGSIIKLESSQSDAESPNPTRPIKRKRGRPKKTINKCLQCNKIFATTHTLRQHYDTHNGIKRYECPTCFQRFTQIGSLNIHKRIHIGEKPYHCPYCSKSDHDPGNMRKHVNLVHLRNRK